jgi:hypothetical protein
MKFGTHEANAMLINMGSGGNLGNTWFGHNLVWKKTVIN